MRQVLHTAQKLSAAGHAPGEPSRRIIAQPKPKSKPFKLFLNQNLTDKEGWLKLFTLTHLAFHRETLRNIASGMSRRCYVLSIW
jgi:hypothetical protein